MYFLNIARHEGHQIATMWQELEEEARLPEGNGRSCLERNWSAADVRAGQDRVRQPPRGHCTHGTVTARRGDIGKDAGDRRLPAQGGGGGSQARARQRGWGVL